MRYLLPPLMIVLLLAAEPVDYLRQVKPLLARYCVECHGPAKQRGGLRLDTAPHLRAGGNQGPAVVVGKSRASLLVLALTGTADLQRMPPREPRPSAAEAALLATWIDQGATAPAREDATVVGPVKRPHWAFVPPKRSDPPRLQGVTHPVDAFVQARLAQAKLTPSPAADRPTLIRRLSLDLLGLPPTPEEVAAFVDDTHPDAYERVVDRLLASPHYGERMARHWLDLARYADSNGFNIDAPRSIWPWRDWVIDAFNRDLPFDRFTVEQLAGDLLPKATRSQQVATGFHRNTLLNQEGGIDVEQFRVESVVDRVNTTGTVWLGLTVGCAQCHDHKFDPLSTREYYQLLAYLNNCDEPELTLPSAAQAAAEARTKAELRRLYERLSVYDPTTPERVATWERRIDERIRPGLASAVREALGVANNGRTPAQEATLTHAVRRYDAVRHALGGLNQPFAALAHAALARDRAAIEKAITTAEKQRPPIVRTLVLRERKQPRTTHVMLGGDFLRKGVRVEPGTPSSLHPRPTDIAPNRLQLANWLVDPANPLTARVTVNRLWQQHFGLGLVETDNDFGTQGSPPTHPELLDWLATEFVRSGWSVKAMHRLIVTSATYRQSSRQRADLAQIDARNRLLARMPRLRLEAEAVRDNALAASGLLSRKIGGPSVFPPQPEGVTKFTQIQRPWQVSTGPDRYRRGLYTHFWRSAPHPNLLVFDAPDSTTACTRRNRSNTPLQALTLLNDAGQHECAQALAMRVLTGGDEATAIDRAFRLCLARAPQPAERARIERFLADETANLRTDAKAVAALVPAKRPTNLDAVELAAWVSVGRLLLNLDECITRE